MPAKRWTLLVVPDGSDAVRSISISQRGIRRMAGGITLGTLAAILAAGFLISKLAAPGSPLASHSGHVLSEQLLAMQARLDTVADTLDVIRERDEQLRLFAGLPLPDSQQVIVSAGSLSAPTPLKAEGSILERLAGGTAADMDRMLQRANTLAASFARVSAAIEHNVERSGRIPSIMPTAGWLSSNFTRSRFHPILHVSRPHEGIDVSAPMGAPIVAPAAGTVTRTTRERGYGLVVEIDHGDGITTRYAHCSRIAVRPGQRVKRGQEIAAVGNTGLSTGPHLHYEIHVNGKVIDPLTYVMPSDAIPD